VDVEDRLIATLALPTATNGVAEWAPVERVSKIVTVHNGGSGITLFEAAAGSPPYVEQGLLFR
jgi:hypothetical protein